MLADQRRWTGRVGVFFRNKTPICEHDRAAGKDQLSRGKGKLGRAILGTWSGRVGKANEEQNAISVMRTDER